MWINIFTLSALFFSIGAVVLRAEPINETLSVDMSSRTAVFSICQDLNDRVSQDELLACYQNMGFPYAKVCLKQDDDEQSEICPGVPVILSGFQFSESLGLDTSLITKLGGFKIGQPYNHKKVLIFAKYLEHKMALEDVEIVFHPKRLNSVEMIVNAVRPKSSIKGWVGYDAFDELMITLSGRHYVGRQNPGFLQYGISAASSGSGAFFVNVPAGRGLTYADEVQFYSGNKFQDAFATSSNKIRYQRLWFSDDIEKPELEIITTGIELNIDNNERPSSSSLFDRYIHLYGTGLLAVNQSNFTTDLSAGLYLRDDSYVTAQLAFSAPFNTSLGDVGDWMLRGEANFQVMAGNISKAPLVRRVFLGGDTMRGYVPYEIGRGDPNDFSTWGLRSAATLQLEAVTNILDSDGPIVGVHFDFGLVSDQSGTFSNYHSYGLLTGYPISEDAVIQVVASRNKQNASLIALSFQSKF